jgi:hypothetical protein
MTRSKGSRCSLRKRPALGATAASMERLGSESQRSGAAGRDGFRFSHLSQLTAVKSPRWKGQLSLNIVRGRRRLRKSCEVQLAGNLGRFPLSPARCRTDILFRAGKLCSWPESECASGCHNRNWCDPAIRPCEVLGRNRGRSCGAFHRDLHRIHSRERIAVLPIAQPDHSLDVGHAEALYV